MCARRYIDTMTLHDGTAALRDTEAEPLPPREHGTAPAPVKGSGTALLPCRGGDGSRLSCAGC